MCANDHIFFHLFFILLSADPDDYEYEYEFEFELDFDFDFEYENVWTLRNLGAGDIIREAIRTVITKFRGRCQSTFAAVISCWDHSLQPFLCLRVSALISSITASGPFATWSSLWCCVASLQFVLQIRM